MKSVLSVLLTACLLAGLLVTIAPKALAVASEPAAPVAVVMASGDQVGTFHSIQFDGSSSYHQDPLRRITSYEWDFDYTGIEFVPEAVGPSTERSFYSIGTYVVALRVTDDNVPPQTAIDTVTVTVNSVVTQPPVATDTSYTAFEDIDLRVDAPGLLGLVTDIDSGLLSVSVVTGPSHGILTFYADGGFMYRPDANWNGTDSFTYKANDGSADSNVATVIVTVLEVNDPPVANEDYKTTLENTELVFPATELLANDSAGPANENGQTLTVIGLVSGETVQGGTVTLVDGIITYTPPAEFYGEDGFAYTVQDNGTTASVADPETDVGGVSVDVTEMNAPPVAVDDSYTIAEDGYLSIETSVLDNDTDAENDPLTAMLVVDPSHGTLELGETGGFHYIPAGNYHGSDTFTYRAYDGNSFSNVATVTITVTPTPDPPTLTISEQPTTTVAGQTITPAFRVGAAEDGEPVAGLEITASIWHGSGMLRGTLTRTTDDEGVATFDDLYVWLAGDKVLRFTESAFGKSVDSIAVTINPAEPVRITIAALPNSIMAGGSVGFLVSVFDEFGNPSPAEFAVTIEEAAGGTWTDIGYTFPNVGTWTATATVVGTSISDAAEVTVIPVTHAPVAVASSVTGTEDTTLTFAIGDFNFSDAEGDAPARIEILTLPDAGTLQYLSILPLAEGSRIDAANIGLLTFIPAAGASGSPYASFTFRVEAGGAWSLNEATLAINITAVNVPPVILTITTPADPVAVGGPVMAAATFTDANTTDTHTAEWDWWGDGSASAGTVTEAGGSGSVSGTYTYTAPGIYAIALTVTDNHGASDQESSTSYVVVYDPDGGFVTGGGWIDSPEGAYAADGSLTGKATFGFVSGYVKGKTDPTGNTAFQFQVAGLNFTSTSYEWLIISGARAQFKGEGTINGSGNYGFILTAIDGNLPGGGTDKFRIKIWDKTTNALVYDNQMGESDNSDRATELGGGSIVIHSGDKNSGNKK